MDKYCKFFEEYDEMKVILWDGHFSYEEVQVLYNAIHYDICNIVYDGIDAIVVLYNIGVDKLPIQNLIIKYIRIIKNGRPSHEVYLDLIHRSPFRSLFKKTDSKVDSRMLCLKD